MGGTASGTRAFFSAMAETSPYRWTLEPGR